MVATDGLRLVYVIAPALALVGAAVIVAVPVMVIDVVTVNVDAANADVARAMSSIPLFRVALAYTAVAAWVAMKYTWPAATIVITPVVESMVA